MSFPYGRWSARTADSTNANLNRTISVDIRFVLFVTEKFGNAKWVVDEIKVAGQSKVAAAK